jgi:hypothetical protein
VDEAMPTTENHASAASLQLLKQIRQLAQVAISKGGNPIKQPLDVAEILTPTCSGRDVTAEKLVLKELGPFGVSVPAAPDGLKAS